MNNGYHKIKIKMCSQKFIKYLVYRFVYVCFNGIIEDNKVIDHIDNNKQNNILSNLQLLTQSENCKKSSINRDYSFAKNNHQNRKYVLFTKRRNNIL